MVLFISTIFVACLIVPRSTEQDRAVGLDFLSFYTAGTAIREGRAGDLYDLHAVRAFQVKLARQQGFELGTRYAPWWNPPFYALLFVPLSQLTFYCALGVWLTIGSACACASCWLLCRMLADRQWQTWALVPVLMVLSMPFINTTTHGQNTCLSLLVLTATVYLWRSDGSWLAGMAGGLLFYKPQLGLVIATAMIWDLGWRAAIGYLVTAAILLLMNILLLPGTLADFLHRVPENLAFVQTQTTYPWERHVTFKAFWRLLFDGTGVGPSSVAVNVLAAVCMIAIATALTSAILRGRRRIDRDRLIAATIVATPLLMPFYFDYDLLLLAVPAVLLARDWRADCKIDRWLLVSFATLFAWLLINPDFAVKTRLNLAVPLLAVVVMLLIRRMVTPPPRRKREPLARTSRECRPHD
jgi:hypothetical protein